MKYRAAFYELFEEEESEIRKYLPPGDYFCTWKTIQEVGDKEPPCSLISIRTQSRIPAEWAEKLDGILTRSAGHDHILQYLKETGKKIQCAYLPEYASRAVAEHAFMMIFALLRKLKAQEKNLSTFFRDGLTGFEIQEKRIAIIGVGRIGGQIADIAYGLRMKIVGVDIVPRQEMVEKYGLEYLSLKEALRNADICVSALPLTDLTKGMLGYKNLILMPVGSFFINISRGEISPSADILRLLEENHLAGVGIDVYEHEKELAGVLRDGVLPESLPEDIRESVNAALKLISHPQVIATPHNAFNTVESVARKASQSAENIVEFLKTGQFLRSSQIQTC